jgi:Shedu protein SduA, C-terminal
MNDAEFQSLVLERYGRQISSIGSRLDSGAIELAQGSILYPQLVVFTHNDDHHIAEFFGASRSRVRLQVKSGPPIETTKYLSQFDHGRNKPVFELNGPLFVRTGGLMLHSCDEEFIAKTFPFIDQSRGQMRRDGGEGSFFTFGPKFGCALISDEVFVHRHESIVRIKDVFHLVIAARRLAIAELAKALDEELVELPAGPHELHGLRWCSGKEEVCRTVAAQLRSLIMVPKIQEVAIDRFLRQHPSVLTDALSYRACRFGPALTVLEPREGEESELIPDAMMLRSDGFWDILDLKTALRENPRLTKGRPARRRFIDKVQEGVAQLANYRAYFEVPAQATYALETYGLKVNNPRLILVIGSYENASAEDLRAAQRMLSEQVMVVDYDTVLAAYLGANSASVVRKTSQPTPKAQPLE